MHTRWVILLGLLLALGCGSMHEASNVSAHDSASAGSAAAIVQAADAGAALPSAAPDRPQYQVPVPTAELAPYAIFDVGKVSWAVNGTNATLEYVFPSALSGVAEQQVSFRGTVTEPGIANVSGSAGSARCSFSAQVVRCKEMMPGLTTDPATAKQMLEAQPISASARMLRANVIQLFSADPIGILTFPSSVAEHAADDKP